VYRSGRLGARAVLHVGFLVQQREGAFGAGQRAAADVQHANVQQGEGKRALERSPTPSGRRKNKESRGSAKPGFPEKNLRAPDR